MPELPEVESVRRQLEPALVGRTIAAAWADGHPRARQFGVDRAVGGLVTAVRRRGKYLLIDLTFDAGVRRELVLHLGMTGALRIDPPAGSDAHDRASLTLDDGRVVRFRDPRRFGRITVVDPGEYARRIPTLARLGPEPLSDDFDAARFAAQLAASRSPVKACLLSQRIVAGVGNIYADEALWRAGIDPRSRRVGRSRAERLHRVLRDVLREAIEREGTTFRDYQMVNGASGRQAAFLDVYGRAGTPCARCATPLVRTVVAQRGTTYCPHCQRW